ncbi:MAG: Xaa-Pro peptidase family protein [Candidatus Dependentiae bacterium]|nr:Xaa-Pro peptidase family protein [Candidatus Dependentiae bacterium]
MLFGFGQKPDVAIYASRRKSLVQAIKDAQGFDGKMLFISGFEREAVAFTQESSFYYLTGINEPGVALLVDATGHSTLYIPSYKESRAKWMGSFIEPTQEWAVTLGVNAIAFLGQACEGYLFGPFFDNSMYASLIEQLKEIGDTQALYTLMPADMNSYCEQRLVMQRLQTMVPSLVRAVKDISALVADLRSSKDMGEIELLKGAVNITIIAHEAAAQTIGNDIPELDVKASLEGVMTMAGARIAFPSIVASGKDSIILHSIENNKTMKNGDLVIVDIGASYHRYAADLTRTYPVSGVFSKRQREVYDIVLAAQEHVADMAQSGFYLSNKNHPTKSLHHIAHKFFADRGYGHYFTHGIGHYLGIDVHDVGDYSRPLREGDIITLEPGLYIPEENIGIRIEDNYWIIKKGAICLSEELPKTADDIELFMQESLSQEEQDSYDDEEDGDDDDDDDCQDSFGFHGDCGTEH